MIYLADYRLMWGGSEWRVPAIPEGKLYQYILADNGVFLHAERTGLEVMSQVAAVETPNCTIRGLQPMQSFTRCNYPKVSFDLTKTMLNWAKSSKDPSGHPIEILFHLVWLEDLKKWELHVPQQEQSATSCKPVGTALTPGGSYEKAFIEVHSHHNMRAFFSSTDDADEQGFRIYGVLGDIFKRPTMRLRVSVYGQFIEVPAGDFFELTGEGDDQDSLLQDAYYQFQVSTSEADNLQEVLEFESEALPL